MEKVSAPQRPYWMDALRFAAFRMNAHTKATQRKLLHGVRLCWLLEIASRVMPGFALNAAFCHYGKDNPDRAREILKEHGGQLTKPNRVHKALWLAGFLNDLDLCHDLMKQWRAKDVKLKTVTRRLYAGLQGDSDSWFKAYNHAHRQDLLNRHFPSRVVPSADREAVLESDKRKLLLTSHGPGDEISFAKILTAIREDSRVNIATLTVGCDSRLYSLMQRSFPDIEFMSLRKVRTIGHGGTSWRDYRHLPDYGLHAFMDHGVVDRLDDFDHIMFVPDFLYRYRQHIYRDDRAYVTADPERIVEMGKLLPKDKLLVGLNWRSMIVNSGRDADYLTIEQIAPVFDIDGVAYVNLQYGDDKDELMWVEQRYPGKLITIPGLDRTDDFEGVAALMINLDAIVAPSTTVAGVAGALAKPILLLCNSLNSIKGWRQADGRDVWFGSTRHVVSTPPGDKNSLVVNLCREIRELSHTSTR